MNGEEAMSEVKHKIGDEEDIGKQAIRLLDLWTETKGAEDQLPYQDTMALLGKPNSAGWIWAREVREERDFDAERERSRQLALQCIQDAEAESARLTAELATAQATYLQLVTGYDEKLKMARNALSDARDSFEFVRLHLIGDLKEPQRSAFWRAVYSRDAAAATLAAILSLSGDQKTSEQSSA